MTRPTVEENTLPLLNAQELRRMGRTPPAAFRIHLTDGSEVILKRPLRILPGKRIVGEGTWAGQAVLAKLFIAQDSHRHAEREHQGLEALMQAGLPTPKLRISTGLQNGGNAVLTEFLPDAKSLAECLNENQPPWQFLRPVFALLGKMHASGLIQDDLHPGNFLLCDGQFFIVDGDAVSVQTQPSAIDQGIATANLALLIAQLPVTWDRFQPDFVGSYCESQTGFRPELPQLARAVEQARHLRLRKFLAKTGRDCTQFLVRKALNQLTIIDRQDEKALNEILGKPDQLIRCEQIIKDGRTCTVAGFDLQPGRSVVVKRYKLKSGLHALSRAWRPSRAWHSWRAGHMLRHLGIATPRPMALIEERFGPLRRRAFLINEFCPGINLLQHLLPDQPPGDAEAQSLLSLFDALHRMKISHGDLKATNLLWDEGHITVIDLDGMRQHASEQGFARAWRRDRARLLANWPASSALFQWLDQHLIPG